MTPEENRGSFSSQEEDTKGLLERWLAGERNRIALSAVQTTAMKQVLTTKIDGRRRDRAARLFAFFVMALLAFGAFYTTKYNDALAGAIVDYTQNPPGSTLTSGLVGWWTFDGKDVTDKIYDKSGQGHDGYFNGGATSSATTAGKLGQALAFDGVNDYVDIPNSGGVADNLSDFTVSVWFKTSVVPTVFAPIINKSSNGPLGASTGWGIAPAIGTNKLVAWIQTDAPDFVGRDSGTINDNKWHQATMVVTGANTLTLYIDGSTAGTVDDSGGTIGSYSTANNIRIATDYGGEFFPGSVDDARVYSRALSPAEVKQLYLTGAGVKLQTEPQTPTTNGLVGWWTFDGKDMNWTTNKAIDESGQGNDGQLTNMSTTTSPSGGKIGQGLKFDGINDSVNTPVNVGGSNNKTFTGWFKFNDISTGWQVMELESTAFDNGTYVGLIIDNTGGGGYVHVYQSYAGGTAYFEAHLSTAPVVGQWYHYAGVIDKTNGHVDLYINGQLAASAPDAPATIQSATFYDPTGTVQLGNSSGGNPFNGVMDEVRIYNRALSASEIKNLYNAGKDTVGKSQQGTVSSGLVGYWSFNGPQTHWDTNTTDDLSGQGNTGTMVNMSTTTSPTGGKIGQGLKFMNGSDQQVAVGSPASLNDIANLTVSAWIRPTSEGQSSSGVIVGKNTANGWRFRLTDHLGTPYLLFRRTFSGSSLNQESCPSIPLNQWTHVAVSFNDSAGTNVPTFYINGVAVANCGTPGTGSPNSDAGSSLYIGNDAGNIFDFDGNIDEVRVYNRILSASEIKQLYNAGR